MNEKPFFSYAEIFCGEPKTIKVFGKETGLTADQINLPDMSSFTMEVWVDEDEMTDEEFEEYAGQFYSGIMRPLTYKQAWAHFWKYTSPENKQKFFELPNFEEKLFKEMTGLDIDIAKGKI